MTWLEERHSAFFISHKDGLSLVTQEQDDDAVGCVWDSGTFGWVSLCGRPLAGMFRHLCVHANEFMTRNVSSSGRK